MAAFSKHHFHRQFTRLFGVGVYRYVQLRRLKRASRQLAFRESMPVTDIALGSGLRRAREAFARAFRKRHGAIAFRIPARAAVGSLDRRLPAPERTEDPAHDNPRIPATRSASSIFQPREWRLSSIAATRVGSACRSAASSSGARRTACRRESARRSTSRMTIRNRHRRRTSARPLRSDRPRYRARTTQVSSLRQYPAGRCAVIRHIELGRSPRDDRRLPLSEWLPGSGEDPRDFPLYFERVSFFPDVPEHRGHHGCIPADQVASSRSHPFCCY